MNTVLISLEDFKSQIEYARKESKALAETQTKVLGLKAVVSKLGNIVSLGFNNENNKFEMSIVYSHIQAIDTVDIYEILNSDQYEMVTNRYEQDIDLNELYLKYSNLVETC